MHAFNRSSRISKKAGILSLQTEQKLLSYAALATAAGTGVLALAQPSEAEIVYTPVSVRIAPPNNPYNLDLNGDGVVDFSIFVRDPASPRGPTFSRRTSAAMLMYGKGSNVNAVNKNNEVPAFAAGVAVGPKITFGTGVFMGGVSAIDGNHPMYAGSWAPAGGSEKNRFVGVKFMIDGEVHYGWVRFNVKIRQEVKGGVLAELTGYAYETEPNTPIVTGKTSGTALSRNEPASNRGILGFLALGSTGLAAWRREDM